MADFSIEMTAERIVDKRSREIFREVYSSYQNGNYRSATVMLWSAVVADLVFKLEELETSFSDPAAASILKDVTETQEKHPTSPQWELDLLEEVKKRTSLLEVTEYENLKALQKQRHLSAHPILTGTRELASPTREMTRAHIRCSLEAVLTKPALMTRKILDSMLEDLERLRDHELPSAELEKFLVAKYLNHMLPKVEDSVFKGLWTLVFKKSDDRLEVNRRINRKALEIVFARRVDHCLSLLASDHRHYGEVGAEGTCSFQLVAFLSRQPRAYGCLPEQAKVLVKAATAADPDLRSVAWFLAGSLEEHLGTILEDVRTRELEFGAGAFQVLRERAERESKTAEAMVDQLAAQLYGMSRNYNDADQRFAVMLKPCMERLSREDMLRLLARIEENGQARGRGRARADHALLKAAAEKTLGPSFNPGEYPYFMASVGKAEPG